MKKICFQIALVGLVFSGCALGDDEDPRSYEAQPCRTDLECTSLQVCNVASGRCEPSASSEGCSDDSDCASGQTCNLEANECQTSETEPPPSPDCGDGCPEGEICSPISSTCELGVSRSNSLLAEFVCPLRGFGPAFYSWDFESSDENQVALCQLVELETGIYRAVLNSGLSENIVTFVFAEGIADEDTVHAVGSGAGFVYLDEVGIVETQSQARGVDGVITMQRINDNSGFQGRLETTLEAVIEPDQACEPSLLQCGSPFSAFQCNQDEFSPACRKTCSDLACREDERCMPLNDGGRLCVPRSNAGTPCEDDPDVCTGGAICDDSGQFENEGASICRDPCRPDGSANCGFTGDFVCVDVGETGDNQGVCTPSPCTSSDPADAPPLKTCGDPVEECKVEPETFLEPTCERAEVFTGSFSLAVSQSDELVPGSSEVDGAYPADGTAWLGNGRTSARVINEDTGELEVRMQGVDGTFLVFTIPGRYTQGGSKSLVEGFEFIANIESSEGESLLSGVSGLVNIEEISDGVGGQIIADFTLNLEDVVN